jgi:transposase
VLDVWEGFRMANRYKVTLTAEERAQLTELTRSGKTSSAKFVHARALLLCDAGEGGDPWKVADVAAALGVTARTIEHLKQRFVEEGMAAALVRKASRKPRESSFDGAFDARLTALACSQAPDGYRRWTVRLLADKLVELKIVESVSTMTVQRSLKKTNCSLT